MSTLDADTYPADDLLPDEEDLPEGWLQRFWRFIRNQSNRVLLLTGVLLFGLAYFWPAIFVTVDSGQVGVMYLRFAGGTVTDRLLGEGLRFVPPWDKLFVYNVRLQEIRHSMSALTEEGLEIKFELSIRYRPELERQGAAARLQGGVPGRRVRADYVVAGARNPFVGVARHRGGNPFVGVACRPGA